MQRALTSLKEAGWLRQAAMIRPNPAAGWSAHASRCWLTPRRRSSPSVSAPADRSSELRAATGLPVGAADPRRRSHGDRRRPGGSAALRTVETTLGPLPVHVSAGGRAILSRLPDATRREVLDRALRRYTPQSITDPAAVLAEVARAERDGYAVTRGGVPARQKRGRRCGARRVEQDTGRGRGGLRPRRGIRLQTA